MNLQTILDSFNIFILDSQIKYKIINISNTYGYIGIEFFNVIIIFFLNNDLGN